MTVPAQVGVPQITAILIIRLLRPRTDSARTRAKRPGLDRLLADTRRARFDVVLVWACDRIARSVRHFLEVLDELSHLNIEFVSFRENRVVIIGAIAELERNLIVERVRAGMRRPSSKASISAGHGSTSMVWPCGGIASAA